jgi:hypothetical protein
MDQDIVSAINRVLLHLNALSHIRIMNSKRNGKGTITALMDPNAPVEMTLHYRIIIITVARTIKTEGIDVEKYETWEEVKIHAIPLVRYMG